jgi:hypothetical protein
MPKQKPILFSTMMVQALLEGRKTQTRRIMKKQPDSGGKITLTNDCRFIIEHWPIQQRQMLNYGRCEEVKPKWSVGDILWVRENWQINSWDFEDGTCDLKYATGEVLECYLRDAFDASVFTAEWLQFQLDAMAEKGILDIVEKEGQDEDQIFYKRTTKHQPFKPSIHMPKEAARIWLKVKSVKAERVHDISEGDAEAEGILTCRDAFDNRIRYKDYMAKVEGNGDPNIDYPTVGIAVTSFCTLWESINGIESWQSNPFVWVIEFEVLSTTGKPETI